MRSMKLVNAVLFGACAVLWLMNGLREQDVFKYFLSAVWLTGAVIWLVRYFRDNKKEN